MNRLVRMLTLPALALALLASPAPAQQTAGRPTAPDIEAVRKTPDRATIIGYFSAQFQAISAALRTDPAAAEKKIAELKSLAGTIKPSENSAKAILAQAKAVLGNFEQQVELARVKLSDLEAKLQAKPDADLLMKYTRKALGEISEKLEEPAAAEKQLTAVKAVLSGVKAKAPEALKKQVDMALSNLEMFEKRLNADKARTELVGKKAAPLEVEAWVNGSPVTDADLKGKVVLIDFWAVWCGPCVATFPHLREWNEKYADKGLVMLGLTNYYNYEWNEKDNRAARAESGKVEPAVEQAMLKKFAASNKLTHRIGIQKGSAMADYYGVTGIPEVVVIDREGKVRLIKVGSGDENAKAIGETLEKLIGAAPGTASR